MELRQLQCLVACAKTKSFSKAAVMLFTSQSNVSKTIASLEKELGKKLFERKQHGIELTEKGHQICKYAADMLEFESRIVSCAQEDDEEELRISFLSGPWFAKVFRSYYQVHQEEGLRYKIMGTSMDEMVTRISGGIDQLGFAWVEEENLSKLIEVFQSNHIGHLVLKKTGTVLYCGKNGGVNGKNELPLIQGIGDLSSAYELECDEESEQEPPKKKIVVTTNSGYIIEEMVQNTDLSHIGHTGTGEDTYLPQCERFVSKTQTENIRLICIFRNDQVLEKQPKQFLSFIRSYVK